MRKKMYAALVLMLALTGVAGCGKSRETAEENIAWETRETKETEETTAETEEKEGTEPRTETTAAPAAGTTGAEVAAGGRENADLAAARPDQEADPGRAANPDQEADPGRAANPDRTANPDRAADPGRAAMIEAYQSALEGILYGQVYPDGTSCNYDNFGSISDNQFAVCDVDRDGRDELIVLFSTSSMAGMLETVYSYDSAAGSLVAEFSEFPGMTFYDNGVATVEWSHNQGLAGDFWPYNVYQYNPDADRYDLIASVDAWDRSYMDTDFEGNPYPADVDLDNDGIVFYIMPDGDYSMEHPVSKREYNGWYNSVLGGAAEVEVPFLNLTENNIKGIW